MAPPQLRGMVQRGLQRSLIRAVSAGLVAGFSYNFFIAWPRKKTYENYYKDFDAEKEAKAIQLEESQSMWERS